MPKLLSSHSVGTASECPRSSSPTRFLRLVSCYRSRKPFGTHCFHSVKSRTGSLNIKITVLLSPCERSGSWCPCRFRCQALPVDCHDGPGHRRWPQRLIQAPAIYQAHLGRWMAAQILIQNSRIAHFEAQTTIAQQVIQQMLLVRESQQGLSSLCRTGELQVCVRSRVIYPIANTKCSSYRQRAVYAKC